MRLLAIVGVCALLVVSPVTAITTAATTDEPPLAEAGLDQTVQRGAGVILDAGGSRDPDGEVTGYDWRIDAPNGTELTPECSDCERTRFTADAVGEYNVTVEVTDDDGNTANDTLYVTVESPPDGPTVSLSGETAPSVDAPVRYDAEATAGDTELGTVEWTVAGRSATEQDVDGESATRSLIHAFDDASPRTVRVTVTDEAGRTASDALRVDPRVERDNGESPEEPSEPEPVSTSQVTETPVNPCRENQAPDVSADVQASGGIAHISAERSDPDGSIVDVRYNPGNAMPLPEVGTTETVTVTVEDDCGATASDMVLVGQKTDKEVTEETKTKRVEYENVIEVQLKGSDGGYRGSRVMGSEIISGSQDDLPGDISGEVDTHSELQAVTDSGEWEVNKDYVRRDDDEQGDAEQTEAETKIITETKIVTTTEININTNITPFTKQGKTVGADLNHDGKIDIDDWREKYPDLASSTRGRPNGWSNTHTQSADGGNEGTDNGDGNNSVEETNSDRDGDGHNDVKDLAEKDDDNNGVAEVCSKGYCMNLDTDLVNKGGANNDNDGGTDNDDGGANNDNDNGGANNNEGTDNDDGGANDNDNDGTEHDELSERAANSQMNDKWKDAFAKYAREN